MLQPPPHRQKHVWHAQIRPNMTTYDLAACLRLLLQSIHQGDEVEWQGCLWRVELLHEDRTVTLVEPPSTGGASGGAARRRVLLRDCRLRLPRGAFRQKKTLRRENLELLKSEDHGRLDATGKGWRNQTRVQPVDRVGCHFILPMALSRPVPPNVTVQRVTLDAVGMDQGWGNTGDSGLLVQLRRAGGDEEEEPLLGIVYDRRRSTRQEHRATSEELRGPFAPTAGDQFRVLLRCPNYPGWNAFCSRLSLRVDCLQEVEEELPWSLSDHWLQEREKAFFRLWAALAEDEYVTLDHSHLSLAGQQQQHVWSAKITDSRSAELLTSRFELLSRHSDARDPALTADALRRATQLLTKLQRNEGAVGAPAQAAERSARYAELTGYVHRTFDGLEQHPKLFPAVVRQYADCVDDCIYRWEREIHNMHDLVTGEVTGSDALDAEDEVLRVLYRQRRQMAEEILHHTKGVTETADMHFESHFYASIHFGLAEQLTARRDPHRLTYLSLDSRVRPDVLQARLFQDYVPSRLRRALREEIFESKMRGAQALREKLTDWLSGHIPEGFREDESPDARREAWLYGYCHDANFRVTNEALNYMMCCMHILSAHPLILQAAGQHLAPPTPPGSARADTEPAVEGEGAGTAGSQNL
ncbi:unnamed protein product [Durusdinium trenchii]|uniref:Uncharacterized protein n=1 Tax=Durusdinium trenchii TaxID=1381693 RepID=A0ABP0PPA2_9DINO